MTRLSPKLFRMITFTALFLILGTFWLFQRAQGLAKKPDMLQRARAQQGLPGQNEDPAFDARTRQLLERAKKAKVDHPERVERCLTVGELEMSLAWHEYELSPSTREQVIDFLKNVRNDPNKNVRLHAQRAVERVETATGHSAPKS
jgi:hypothetical protein